MENNDMNDEYIDINIIEEPDTEEEIFIRQCRTCLEDKKITDFVVRSTYQNNSKIYSFKCKACKNGYESLRNKKNKGLPYDEDELHKYSIINADYTIPKSEQGLIFYEGRLVKNQSKYKKVAHKVAQDKKRLPRMFFIEKDLVEKLQTVTKKSDLINILIRNHFS